jgi:transcription antitermination factor NusG
MTKDNKDNGLEKNWYPLYTKSRYEKKAYQNLINAGYEAFLPLQKSLRQWSDRKKFVDMPLFSSYVFVRIPKTRLYDVLQVPGVVRFIYFNNKPATVRDKEIELIKKILFEGTEVEVLDGKIETGTPITITSGLFSGYEGIIKRTTSTKLIIEIESINKTLLVTIDKNLVQAK